MIVRLATTLCVRKSLEAERETNGLGPRVLPFTLLSTWEPRYEPTD